MRTCLFSVGDGRLNFTFSSSSDFFLADSVVEAKERFHKFLKAYIEDHPFSFGYRDFVLYNYGTISNDLLDYANNSLGLDNLSPMSVCSYVSFSDLEAYREQVLEVFKRTIDVDSVASIVREQLAIINNSKED